METPAPVNISRIKAVMAKVQELDAAKTQTKGGKKRVAEAYEPEYPTTPVYDESDEREPHYTTPNLTNFEKPVDYTDEQVMKSNLPDSVKEAMLKQRIPRLTMPPSKFSIEDLGDLVDKKPIARRPTAPITESAGAASDYITISKSELRKIIDERIIQVLGEEYKKTITENAIKSTINTLIKEGKISVKKK